MHKKKRDFKIDVQIPSIQYEPLMDKHLQYYFASRNNRRILVKSKIINRKNQILDRSLNKLVVQGQLTIGNSFRVKQSKSKKQKFGNVNKTIDVNHRFLEKKIVGKKQFDEFLSNQKIKLRNKTSENKRSLSKRKNTSEQQNETAIVPNKLQDKSIFSSL